MKKCAKSCNIWYLLFCQLTKWPRFRVVTGLWNKQIRLFAVYYSFTQDKKLIRKTDIKECACVTWWNKSALEKGVSCLYIFNMCLKHRYFCVLAVLFQSSIANRGKKQHFPKWGVLRCFHRQTWLAYILTTGIRSFLLALTFWDMTMAAHTEYYFAKCH